MGLIIKYKDVTIKELKDMSVRKRNKILKGENKLSILLLNIFLRKKKLMILFFIILSNIVNGQCDTTKLDTIAVSIHSYDTSHNWNYYHGNGVLLWGEVPEYDINLIPPDSGYVLAAPFLNPYYTIIKGWAIMKWNKKCEIAEIKYLNAKKKEIKGRFINPFSHTLIRKN